MKNKLKIDLSVLSWIWQTLSKKKLALLLLILIQTGNGLIVTERSLVLKDLIDHATAGQREGFVKSLAIIIGLILFQLVILSYYRHLQAKTQYGVEMTLKRRLYGTLMKKQYASVKEMHTAQWNQRLTSDTSSVASLSVNTLPGFVGLMTRMISALVALFYLVPALVILMIPFGIALLGVSMILKRTTKKMYHDIQDADGRYRVFLQEHLSNLMMIRVFNKEKMSLGEGDRVMADHMDKIMKRNTFMIYIGILGSLAMNGMYLLGMVLGGVGILKGTISYGTFSAVLTLVMQTQGQMSGVSSYFSSIFQLSASAERLMAAEAYPDEKYGPRPASEVNEFYKNKLDSMVVENATFSYKDTDDEQRVFSDLNLKIRKGEFIALTGESGCGKSTILKVLMCIFPLDAGKMFLVDGENHQNVELNESWRGLFAYVPQGNQLMLGSIRDVIAFGEEVDEERMANALEIACAQEFVEQLEAGLDTVLGEAGSGLSEGQMQRISIARAIYSDRPVLLLDESTSALDQDTESRLLKNVRSMTDKTVLIVTHRPAALEICDREISFTECGVEDKLCCDQSY